MTKKYVLYLTALSLLLNIFPAPALQAEPAYQLMGKKIDAGFKEFQRRINNYAKLTKEESRFLWKYALKKINNKATTQQENDRALYILKFSGKLTLAALIAIAIGIVAYKKINYQIQHRKRTLRKNKNEPLDDFPDVTQNIQLDQQSSCDAPDQDMLVPAAAQNTQLHPQPSYVTTSQNRLVDDLFGIIKKNNPQAIEEAVANFNKTSGRTGTNENALHIAVRHNRIDMIKYLLNKAPALQYEMNNENKTPLDLAPQDSPARTLLEDAQKPDDEVQKILDAIEAQHQK